ncbi:MAG: SpoIIE family protein phosphatase [Flavobacteriales bacterium]|nr:SpoIIE family protein phosphatase [Flavobacteriales bacterium]
MVKNIYPQIKIENVDEAKTIRERIKTEDNLYSYIELPIYLKMLKEGISLKRQYLFKVERSGYGIIFSKTGGWEEPINRFFDQPAFPSILNDIIHKHLGEDVKELVLGAGDSTKNKNDKEIALLANEREIQSDKIERQELEILQHEAQRNYLLAGGLIILIVLIMMIYNYRIKKIANEALTAQKIIIEDKNTQLERLSLVASRTENVILITDAEGELEWLNDSFVRLNNLTMEQLIVERGSNIKTISNNAGMADILDECARSKKPYRYDSLNITNDGTRIWESSTLTPIYDEQGKLKSFIIIDTDITQQKDTEDLLSQKNKDITDSINYARRIQEAVLPSEKVLDKAFSDHFVLLKPKDVVSGDFYWFAQQGDHCIIVLADCTGHGVPGAFMSMMGSNFLGQIVTDNAITSTSEALEILDNKVRAALKNENISSSDGMDIVFMAYHIKTMQLEFSGGMNSILHLRGKELTKYKGDRLSIGGHEVEDKKFTSITIKLQKGDSIYTSTDGFQDQFGGPKGKKFKQKQLLELIHTSANLSFDGQKMELEKRLLAWMEGYQQVDDISIIGFRV